MNHLYIVDDDEAVRRSLVRLISRQSGVAIEAFASGDAFLAARHRLEPGVVLLDFHMKGADGIAVLKMLRDTEDHFATVMLTAHGGVARSVEAMKAGAHDFLEKPYDPADLMLCLEESFAALHRKRASCADRNDARTRLGKLSTREKQVLRGLVEGYSNKIIGFHLGISPRTVEIYRAHLMGKLEVRSLAEALHLSFLADELYAQGVGAAAAA